MENIFLSPSFSISYGNFHGASITLYQLYFMAIPEKNANLHIESKKEHFISKILL